MRVLADWLLTPERVALHTGSCTGVVADLHLGYAQARARGGEAVPARQLADALAPLAAALKRHGARRLVIAGDLLEDGRRGREEVVEELRRWLEGAGLELAAVVPGNHDRGLGRAALPICAGGYRLGGWLVVHGDGALPDGPVVQGHEHPYLRWGRLEAACYLVGADRLVLPAFSPDAAGVNVVGAQRWAAYRCCPIAGQRVLDLGMVEDLKRTLAADEPA
jgi:putative SbcD/Mre11-related phosphoesterase